MNFLCENEFLLLMVHCEGRAIGFENQHILDVSERTRLREVGIQTAHEQPAWALIEPARGQYDWAYLDNIIQRNRSAGMKSLIQLPGWRVPSWVPPEWRARQQNGAFENEQLSLWNKDAQEYLDGYCRTVINKYLAPDIMFFWGEFQGGEGSYPPSSCFFDTNALNDFHSKFGNDAVPNILEQNTLSWFKDKIVEHHIWLSKWFYPQYKELWDCKQELMDRWTKAFGNYAQPDILEAYQKEFPDSNLVLLQYTYFDDAHTEIEKAWVDMLIETFKCETIVEAMFCGGLPKTTPLAIAKGFRGQIVHPANNSAGETFEQWMVDNIRNSHDLWKSSRGL